MLRSMIFIIFMISEASRPGSPAGVSPVSLVEHDTRHARSDQWRVYYILSEIHTNPGYFYLQKSMATCVQVMPRFVEGTKWQQGQRGACPHANPRKV